MIFEFFSSIHSASNRTYIAIPFNVWEETGLKGNIPVRIWINGNVFECKLIPKGGGEYVIPVKKVILSKLPPMNEYKICMETINGLMRINHDSPYSKEHPIRKIDRIDSMPIQKGLCGQSCIAMLAGVALEDVVKLMGKQQASWSKIMEALDYYGISYASKMTYTRGWVCQLPDCCIVNNNNSFVLLYKGAFCNMANVVPEKTVSYLEIFINL